MKHLEAIITLDDTQGAQAPRADQRLAAAPRCQGVAAGRCRRSTLLLDQFRQMQKMMKKMSGGAGRTPAAAPRDAAPAVRQALGSGAPGNRASGERSVFPTSLLPIPHSPLPPGARRKGPVVARNPCPVRRRSTHLYRTRDTYGTHSSPSRRPQEVPGLPHRRRRQPEPARRQVHRDHRPVRAAAERRQKGRPRCCPRRLLAGCGGAALRYRALDPAPRRRPQGPPRGARRPQAAGIRGRPPGFRPDRGRGSDS